MTTTFNNLIVTGTFTYPGSTGTQGTQGPTGAQGAAGTQGPTGAQGAAGPQGSTGAQGAAGTQGATGAQGAIGSQGLQGAQGVQGSTGAQGVQGSTGTQGTQGATGAQGAAGTQGATGAQGAIGSQGLQGAQGVQGSTGAQGVQGSTGAQGPAGGTNASTINITDTTTTAGTYYPTFVSSAGSTQTLRVDSQYLQYNPNVNVLQNPSFLISNGTETSTDSGLVIGGAGSNVKTFTTTKSSIGVTQVGMNFTSSMTGTSSSSMELTSASSTLNGRFSVICYNKPSNYMTNQILLEPDWTNVATKGIKIEQNYIVGGENALLTGFTTNNNLSSTYSSYEGTTEESRVDVAYDNVSIKSGTIGSPSDILAMTTSGITATPKITASGGINIGNAINTITISNPLTFNCSNQTFKNFYNNVNITTAITISSISFSNPVAGGSYLIYITTGAGGSFTFNTGITNVKTTFSSAFTIPQNSVGLLSAYYINAGGPWVVGINILT